MATPISVLRRRLAEQIKRAELAEAQGPRMAAWAVKLRRLATETEAELARRGLPQAGARAYIEAEYGNPARH